MRITLPFFVFLLLGFMSACQNRNQQAQKQPEAQYYPTVTLKAGPAVLETKYPAVIKGQEDIEIRPRIDGFIENIYIDEGSVVKQGQILFRINSPDAIQAVAAANAAISTAQANLNTAKLNVDRMRPLAEKNIISKVQLQTYENQLKSAEASVNQAEATLKQAEETWGWTNVKSPVDGIAGSIDYRQGSLVSSTNVLTTIANTKNVFAYFSLNEKELNDLLSDYEGSTQKDKIAGMPEVTLILANDSVYPEKGRIETISGTVNVSTGTANLRAEFPNRKGYLRSGNSGQVAIPKYLNNVYKIPRKATFTQLDHILVYKVQGDSVVQTVINVKSLPDGLNYVVTRGLKDGDKIVSDGVATLSNGKKIKVD